MSSLRCRPRVGDHAMPCTSTHARPASPSNCFMRSGPMNLPKSWVPFGTLPRPSAIVIVSSFDQPVALGVDRISNPCGASRFDQRVHERGRVGDMLDDFHAGDEVELSLQPLDIRRRDNRSSGPAASAWSRAAAISFARHPTRYLRAEPRQRLRQQPRPAADVERRPSRQRRPRAFVALPMLVDLVADIFQPHRVQLVQHRFGPVRVPPVARLAGELLDLAGIDAAAVIFLSMPSSLAKRKQPHALERRWTISSSTNGELYCEDVPLAEIAATVGTPVYVYSTATMCRHVEALRSALAPLDDPLIAYAVKANPNSAVIATLAKTGLGADVVSGGEYRRARAAGVPGDKIVFSGVGKTEEEMAHGARRRPLPVQPRIGRRSGDAFGGRHAHGRTAPVGFRVNPDVAAGGHAKITTGAAENKFGIAIARSLEAYARAAALPGPRCAGCRRPYRQPAHQPRSARTRLHPRWRTDRRASRRRSRDQGRRSRRRLGVPYDPDLPLPPSPDDYGAMVCRIAGGWNARLVFEPGRLIVGNAGVLLSRVIRVKPGASAALRDRRRGDERPDAAGALRCLASDRGRAADAAPGAPPMSSAPSARPATHSRPAAKWTRSTPATSSSSAPPALMPRPCRAPTTAAPLTPEVLVDGDRWAVVRPRVDVAALIAGDRVPAWLGGCAGPVSS